MPFYFLCVAGEDFGLPGDVSEEQEGVFREDRGKAFAGGIGKHGIVEAQQGVLC